MKPLVIVISLIIWPVIPKGNKMSTEDLIIDAFAKQLVCPVCTDKDITQPMAQCGDYPDNLFCPHCDLGIELSHPFNLGDKSEFKYIGHRVKEFLSRWLFPK